MTTPGKNIMLGTAGHVDHGKTALVKLLTGCETDRLAEEKKRGLTIELGFAPCTMSDERIVGIVDVPGHAGFIRNMVAGAHGIDVVMLVIAADDGVMPQTREHLDILTLMGVRHGFTALTKTDLVDQELLQMVTEEIRDFQMGTFLEGMEICPVSNITGEGFDNLFAALNKEVSACEARECSGLFRLWIERVFNIRGFGAVVSGIPTSGTVSVGDRLRLLPDGLTGRVRSLQVYGNDAQQARAGECTAINIRDIGADELVAGKVLVESDSRQAVSMIEADLRILDHMPSGLKDYAEVHLHIGTAETMAHVAILDGKLISPGESRLVQLRLAEPIGAAEGDRFVVRSGLAGLAGGRTTTIGGGRVIGVRNIRLRRNRPWTLTTLAERRDALDSAPRWCETNLKQAGKAMSIEALAQLAQRSVEPVRQAMAELKEQGAVVETEHGLWAHREVIDRVAGGITEALETFHQANPTRAGISDSDLPELVQADPAVLELALAELIAGKAVLHQGALIALPGRQSDLSEQDAQLCQRLEEALLEAYLSPPLPADLADSLRISEEKLITLVHLLSDRGMAVQLDRKVIMHNKGLAAARQVVLDLFARSGSFETVEFRDAVGVSRKYAVALLDYFDTIRLTSRSGSRRKPGAEAKKLL